MLELIIAVLISMGYQDAPSGTHFTMDANHAEKIQNVQVYQVLGGDREFYKYVSIDDRSNDIVIVDDDNPRE